MTRVAAGAEETSTRARFVAGGAVAVAAALVGSAVRSPDSAFGATAPLDIQSDAPGSIPLVVRGADSQDVDLQRWVAADGSALGAVDKAGQLTARHLTVDTAEQGPSVSPELHYKAANGFWLSGIDWASAVPARDHVIAAKVDHPVPGSVMDFLYAAHRGTKSPTLSVGNSSVSQDIALATFTGPSGGGGTAAEPSLGGMLVRHPNGATAPALMVRRGWSGANVFAVLPDGTVQLRTEGNARTLRFDAPAGALAMADPNVPVRFANQLRVTAAPAAGNFVPLVRVRQDGDQQDRFRVRSDGALFWGTGEALDPGTQLWRYGPGMVRAEGKLAARGGLGFGNSVAVKANQLGPQVRAFQIFDDEGRSLGFVPLHSS
ncbi:MAG: hypothetical protein M3389_08455 [Actinomycetota bacterium]|nr:hypothetical protein [Actinomycetota bacterium]